MQTDYIDVGGVPCNEDCVQLDDPDYYERTMKEGLAFINQLRRVFGPEPEGFRMFMKGHPHDFGTYHMLRLQWTTEEGEVYAMRIEGECPEDWDEEAKAELGLIEDNQYQRESEY